MIKEIEKILSEISFEAKAEAKLIIESISGLTVEDIILGKEIKNKDEIYRIANLRAKTGMPVQYLLGFSYFMGKKYAVDENVLIPRDETEFLVRKSYELIKNKSSKINVLDIGLGSGCISIELARLLKKKDIEILGVDIMTNALCTALKNIQLHDMERKVIIRKSDIFSKIRDMEKFDLIVSNPPYIPKKDFDSIQIEVKKFEPKTALFTEDDKGIFFYEKIINNAAQYLKKDGILAFEIGINQAEDVKNLLEKNNYKNIEITKDLAGIERVITANI